MPRRHTRAGGAFLSKCLTIVRELGIDRPDGAMRTWCDGRLKIDLVQSAEFLVVTEIIVSPKCGRYHVCVGSMFGSEHSRVRMRDLKRLHAIVENAMKILEARTETTNAR